MSGAAGLDGDGPSQYEPYRLSHIRIERRSTLKTSRTGSATGSSLCRKPHKPGEQLLGEGVPFSNQSDEGMPAAGDRLVEDPPDLQARRGQL
jgi:hypothetical protein